MNGRPQIHGQIIPSLNFGFTGPAQRMSYSNKATIGKQIAMLQICNKAKANHNCNGV